MNLIARLNARLVGVRIYLLAFLFSLPDILNAVVGFDWSTVLPAGYEGFGTRIGAALTLARLVLPPMLKNLRDAARGPGPGPGEEPR
ncbi:hypothetical protein MMB17_07570 [Methylobacterium organophilum]|uniref:hypothetical protein n=1 Tax=Methylobacterium organophilum TaxID=410 RepID=UPI001F1342B4|nr:hypothetical protein [Methylobacterium organophilum]UMY19149.1 hypothetical protein MMB17_07570 [Methylobacterium organophilum]